MTIRKITGRTSSLAVSALLISAGIPRASITQNNLIKRIADASSSLIPKAHVTLGRLIDHILFEPGGYGNQSFLDYIFISERPRFDVLKSLSSAFTATENIFVNYVRGRNPADAVDAAELIALLLNTRRSFEDNAAAADRPFLFINRPVDSDSIGLEDLLFITRIRYLADAIDLPDQLDRLVEFYRTFDDPVGMIDNYTLIDGSTYSLNRQIFEFVTVGTSSVEVDRLSGDALERVSFFIDKVLDPDMELLSQLALYQIKGLTDVPEIDEQIEKLLTKPLTDNTAAQSRPAVLLDKIALDQTTALQQLFALSLNKYLSDTATMIDSMDVGDQFTYDSIKEFADLLLMSESAALYMDKVLFDAQNISDINALLNSLAKSDDFSLTDAETFSVNKGLADVISMLDEAISLVRPYNYADSVTVLDPKSLYVTKQLADSVLADDPLIRLTDGNIFYSILSKNDDQPMPDYFARSTRTYRYPHHGFLEFTTYPDFSTKFVNVAAKTGAYTNYNNLLRINRLLVNADFENPNWDRTGTTVEANVVDTPISLAALSRNAEQDAAAVAELFEAGSLWWSEVPLAEFSLADSLYEDTSTGLHNIYATTTRDFRGKSEFAFALYVKAQSRRYIRFDIGQEFYAIYDLQTSTASVVESNSNAHISLIGSGWYLCSITDKFPTSILAELESESGLEELDAGSGLEELDSGTAVWGDQTVNISVLNNSLSSSYTGTGQAAFYVWGAQLEVDDQVFQEISSLNFVKTGNYENSRLGYNSMPEDRDRVFVGTYLRNSDIYTVRHSGDPHELIKFWVNKTIKDFAPSVDATELSDGVIFYTIYQFTDSFSVGRTEGYKLAGDDTERTPFWFDKSARLGTTSEASIVRWERSNLLYYSEDFVSNYWIKNNALAQKNLLLTSGNLPYRNPTVDADRIVGELEYKDYTYHENRWYDLVPRLNKPDFTSTVVTDIFENATTSTHYVSSIIYDGVQDNNLFSLSVYASPINGVSKFRLDSSNIYADFDLSSVTVTNSSGTVHADITVIDSSNLVYLCRIMGPAIRLDFPFVSANLTTLQTLTDDLTTVFDASRMFEHDSTVADTDGIDLALILDYESGSGTEDYESGSGTEDFAEI